ncbi:MAG: DMT family transporter [Paracoccaceae bacterium]
MNKRDRIDAFGAVSLTGFALFLAFNQIVIKWVNEGLQPVFFAGLRSALAFLVLTLWFALARRPQRLRRRDLVPGVLAGAAFALEFVFLFIALDLTSVAHTAILLYSMPVWMALMAHVFLPGERLTAMRSAGLALAFAGVGVAILWRGGAVAGAHVSLTGDLCALAAAVCWAAIAIIVKSLSLREVKAETQLYWQLMVSAPILLVLSPLFGPLLREFQPAHLLGIAFQALAVASAGFMFWLWLLSIYPASGVASFSFLTPVFGVALGWLLLGEPLTAGVFVALVLVALGMVLINRPAREAAGGA